MIHELLADESIQSKFAMPQQVVAAGASVEIKSMLGAAVKSPIMYPPLAESVFAGDTVAIVVQNDLPEARAILEALVECLCGLSIAATDVSIVISKQTADAMSIDPRVYRMPDETKDEQPPVRFPLSFGFNEIVCQVHDASNDAGLAYLNANEDGDPVYVNRLLVDADVVIPIGFVEPGDDTRQTDCIYPDFSAVAAQDRFANGNPNGLACRSEVALANDMLGSFFSIQLVSGPGGELAEVLCGERTRTKTAAREKVNERWTFEYSGVPEVVLASIETEPENQTWDDVVEAVLTSSQLISGKGPIIVLSDLSSKPNKKIRKALLSQFDDGPEKKSSAKLRSLAGVVAERSIFLKSELPAAAVEELGLGNLDSVEQVSRVAEPFQLGVLIRDAHKCQLKL
jgi:hypothetical protein